MRWMGDDFWRGFRWIVSFWSARRKQRFTPSHCELHALVWSDKFFKTEMYEHLWWRSRRRIEKLCKETKTNDGSGTNHGECQNSLVLDYNFRFIYFSAIKRQFRVPTFICHAYRVSCMHNSLRLLSSDDEVDLCTRGLGFRHHTNRESSLSPVLNSICSRTVY